MLAIDYADEAPLGTLGVNAYAYPYIGGELLDSVLPYLTYLTPFTYGITPAESLRRSTTRACSNVRRTMAQNRSCTSRR